MATYEGWERDVLRRIGAPPTSANISFLDLWQHYEGGTAANNPLNTTQPAGGATDYNSVGVKNYPSAAAGGAATAQTLLNGRYPNVLLALRSGKPNDVAYHNKNVGAEISVWGTKAFAALLGSGGGGVTSAAAAAVHGAASVAAPITGPITSVTGFIGKLTDPSYILRGLQVAAGGVLVLVGVVLLARQVALAADLPDPIQSVPAAKAANALT